MGTLFPLVAVLRKELSGLSSEEKLRNDVGREVPASVHPVLSVQHSLCICCAVLGEDSEE